MAQNFGFAAGKAVGRGVKAEAEESLPDDYQGQREYILSYIAEMLEENKNPYGKPWSASFWRGLGTELGR